MIKTSLNHLPESKQQTIREIRRIILNEIEGDIEEDDDKRYCYIVWLVLFGSYARGDYVDNPVNGYLSDYDILVAVNGKELANDTRLWFKLEDKIDRLTRSPLNLIVHTHEDVSKWLREGHYFFSDIRKEGIYLYTSKGKGMPEPKNLSNAERLPIAEQHFNQWFESGERFYINGLENLDKGWYKEAAFMLHQAIERFYCCILLVLSNYRPRTHNIRTLRNMAIEMTSPNDTLAQTFPGNNKFERRCFELLKRAYIDARYSEHYHITIEELSWLAEQVFRLKTAVENFCSVHIKTLTQ